MTDLWGGVSGTATMSRGEVIGHAAAEIAHQLSEKGMPPEEICRLFLVGYIGMSKSLGVEMTRSIRDVRERWNEIRVQKVDPKHVIEIS